MKTATRTAKRAPKSRQRRPKRHSKPSQAIVKAAPAPLSLPERVEQVLIAGDLSPLTPQERVEYYRKVCESLGLNWLTQPFTYILFRESDQSPPKLQLYANKDCAAQLRKLHRVSIVPPMRREIRDGMCYVEADLRDGFGKTDSATGVVPLWKWKDRQRIDLTGRELANAVMKCETKAKRRGTLSICGLAFLDESELDTMEVIGGVTKGGRIYQFAGTEPAQLPGPTQEQVDAADANNPHLKKFQEREAEQLAEATPCLAYRYYPESNTYQIGGSADLVKANKDLLAPLWNANAGCFVATAEQLGRLIAKFEDLKVPFREQQ